LVHYAHSSQHILTVLLVLPVRAVEVPVAKLIDIDQPTVAAFKRLRRGTVIVVLAAVVAVVIVVGRRLRARAAPEKRHDPNSDRK